MAVDPSVQHSHTISANGSSETQLDLKIIPPDNCQASSQLANQGHQNIVAVCENSSSNVLSRTLLKMCTHLTDTVRDTDIDELNPPGFENKSETLVPLRISKIRSSRSHECFPKIAVYVALAMCRQKLHDDVLRECNSLFIADSLNKFLVPWCSSRKRCKLDSMEVGFIDFLLFPPHFLQNFLECCQRCVCVFLSYFLNVEKGVGC